MIALWEVCYFLVVKYVPVFYVSYYDIFVALTFIGWIQWEVRNIHKHK